MGLQYYNILRGGGGDSLPAEGRFQGRGGEGLGKLRGAIDVYCPPPTLFLCRSKFVFSFVYICLYRSLSIPLYRTLSIPLPTLKLYFIDKRIFNCCTLDLFQIACLYLLKQLTNLKPCKRFKITNLRRGKHNPQGYKPRGG